MQRGGRAARCLRQFGNVDLDTTVKEIEAKSKQAVDGNLPHPWDVQRDENETCCGDAPPATIKWRSRTWAMRAGTERE